MTMTKCQRANNRSNKYTCKQVLDHYSYSVFWDYRPCQGNMAKCAWETCCWDSKSVKGVPYAAPSSISVLVIPATLENELSKTLFLQSLQMPGGTNRTIFTFKKNSPRNVKTNAVCLNRNVLCKLKWKTVKRMTGSGENNDQINWPISNRWFLDGPKKKKTKTKTKTNDQLLNCWVEGKVELWVEGFL